MSSRSKDYWLAEERIHRLEDAGRYLEAEQEARELVAADPNASGPQ